MVQSGSPRKVVVALPPIYYGKITILRPQHLAHGNIYQATYMMTPFRLKRNMFRERIIGNSYIIKFDIQK